MNDEVLNQSGGTFDIYINGAMIGCATSPERVDEIVNSYATVVSCVVTYFGVELNRWRKNYPTTSGSE